jgi:hypothetical protein
MEIRKTIDQIFSLVIESCEVNGNQYVETNLKVFVPPSVFIQLLAWDGTAQLNENETLFCPDWRQIPPEILYEIKMTSSTGYRSILSGKNKADENGYYTFSCVKTTAIYEENGINANRILTSEEIKKRGKNFQKWEFPQ